MKSQKILLYTLILGNLFIGSNVLAAEAVKVYPKPQKTEELRKYDPDDGAHDVKGSRRHKRGRSRHERFIEDTSPKIFRGKKN